MTTEIKRKTWSQFCKKFNATNQYRTASLRLTSKDRKTVDMDQNTPFLGLALTKTGRTIEGVALYTGKLDPERLTEPTLQIRQPEKIVVEHNGNGMDSRLVILGKDGTQASVALSGPKDLDHYRSFVQQVAYSIFERRGQSGGHDFDDWVEAEKKIKEAELQLTR
jgi:hypothetical protein